MSTIEETKQWILNEVWPEIVKSGKICKNSECPIKLSDISVTPIGLEEAYMLTSCHRVRIDYSCGDKQKSLNLITKKTPTTMTPENFEAINFNILFHNEISAYNKIIPRLLKMSKKEESEQSLPLYYYSKISDFEASIVLGDFKEQGFRMCPDRVGLSLEHIYLAMEHIAFFHGLSYAYKQINPKEFHELVALAKEARYAKPPPTQFTEMHYITLNKLKQASDKYYSEIPKDFQDKLFNIITDHFDFSKKLVQPVEPLATICHGDYLRNNIAFAYDDLENPTEPKKAMMFDFQTIRYSSPMLDLTTLLSITAASDVRLPNFDKIFDTYHKKLTSTFEELTNLPAPVFLSRSNLLKEYVRFLPYSIGIAAFFLPTMYQKTDMIHEMLGTNVSAKEFEENFLALGGEQVDKELASLQKELYEFCISENVNALEL